MSVILKIPVSAARLHYSSSSPSWKVPAFLSHRFWNGQKRSAGSTENRAVRVGEEGQVSGTPTMSARRSIGVVARASGWQHSSKHHHLVEVNLSCSMRSSDLGRHPWCRTSEAVRGGRGRDRQSGTGKADAPNDSMIADPERCRAPRVPGPCRSLAPCWRGTTPHHQASNQHLRASSCGRSRGGPAPPSAIMSTLNLLLLESFLRTLGGDCWNGRWTRYSLPRFRWRLRHPSGRRSWS